MFINHALRTAHITHLQDLDGDHEFMLRGLKAVAYVWPRVPYEQFAAMLRDTWRSAFCHLVLVDQDDEMVKGQTSLCPSSILHLKIDYGSLVKENAFAGLSVTSLPFCFLVA